MLLYKKFWLDLVFISVLAIMTTAYNMNITARYYLNRTQTVAYTMNDTVSTPFWRNDTTGNVCIILI